MFLLRSHWEMSEFRHDKSLSHFQCNLLLPMISLCWMSTCMQPTSTCGIRWNSRWWHLSWRSSADTGSQTPTQRPIRQFRSSLFAPQSRLSWENIWSTMAQIKAHHPACTLVGWIMATLQIPNSVRKEGYEYVPQQVLPGILYYPLPHNIRWLGYEDEERDWESTTRTLQYARALGPQPLRLLYLSRISVGKAVGGQHFEAAFGSSLYTRRWKPSCARTSCHLSSLVVWLISHDKDLHKFLDHIISSLQ